MTNCCLPTEFPATNLSSASSPRPLEPPDWSSRAAWWNPRRTSRGLLGFHRSRTCKSTRPRTSPLAAAADRAAEIFPWFIHNALVHYLSPRGLEQYSGGGWGTRDVCQGPVELLLALGRFEPIRDLLCRVFRQQNTDGDWPQWFMFFDRERNIRPGDSHGDIVYWPVLALAQYLSATGDAGLLDETLPFFHSRWR